MVTLASRRRVAIAFAGLIGLALAAADDAGASDIVRIYDRWQLTVTNDGVYTNPFDFTEIELRIHLVSPSGREIDFFGVYDGDGLGGQLGNVWRVWFMPDETGTWRYTYSWTDGTPGGSGVFGVTYATNRGPLGIDPDHPHHLTYANGERYFWNGDSEWNFLSESFTDAERSDAIAYMAEHRVNNFLMALVDDHVYDVFPWEGTRSSHDKSRYQLSKMNAWDAVIQELLDHGIVADLWVYSDDSTSLIAPAYSQDEEQFYTYIVGRFGAFSNVTWNVALEHDEYRDNDWAAHRAAHLSSVDVFQHLVSAHQLQGPYPFAGNPDFDHTALQSFTDGFSLNQLVLDAREATIDAGHPIPIMMEEYVIEGWRGTENMISGIWGVITAGGYYKGASLGWKWGEHYTTALHFDYNRLAYEFMTQLPYWEMVPANALTSHGLALAKDGAEFVVYVPDDTEFTLDLSSVLPTETLIAEWFDPRVGGYTTIAPVAGGGPVAFVPPTNDDWVLHVGGEPGQLLEAPATIDGPRGLVLAPNPAPGQTAHVRLELEASSRLTARLFDVSGREVRSLFERRRLGAGVHDVPLDTRRLPAGVYVLALASERWNVSRKLVVGDTGR